MQVMIDLETLALTPDAAILQIGAVKFDNTGIGGYFDSGAISLQNHFDNGRKVSETTLQF